MPPGGPDPIEPPPGLDTPRVDTAAGPRSRRHVAKAIIDKGKYHAARYSAAGTSACTAAAAPIFPTGGFWLVLRGAGRARGRAGGATGGRGAHPIRR